jgi:hypothetical protein
LEELEVGEGEAVKTPRDESEGMTPKLTLCNSNESIFWFVKFLGMQDCEIWLDHAYMQVSVIKSRQKIQNASQARSA